MSEARFRTLIERSTDMIVLLDEEARITFWSPSATEALGWEPGEVQREGTSSTWLTPTTGRVRPRS